MIFNIKSNRFFTWLVSFGTVLEYYDLAIYGLLTKYISYNFYPKNNGLFWTFLVFVFGQIMRCFGGIILGILGDHYGKEKIFFFSISIMALATLIMGLLPPTTVLGISATLLFSLGRLIQSIAFGAEFPGALTVLSAHAKQKKLGRSVGNMMAMSSFGMAIGICFISLETRVLTEQQMFIWGFRIPFLIGGTLALICSYLRKYLSLTISNNDHLLPNDKKICWKDLFEWRKYIKISMCLMGISLFPATISVLKSVFSVYLNQYYNWPSSKIFLMIGLGYFLSVALKVFGGYLADFYNKITVIRYVSCLGTLGIIFVFWFLPHKGGLLFFVIYTNTLTSIATASYLQLFTESYPYQIRYTWVSSLYNTVSILASLVPLIMNFSFDKFNTPLFLLITLIILGILMCLGSFLCARYYVPYHK